MNFVIFGILAASFLPCLQAEEIEYEQVAPFPEPKPTTTEYTIGLKFKPLLTITTACRPYPAVDESGNTNEGLSAITLGMSYECVGSPLGSQVYGRSTKYKDVWAIMYAFYFPRDRSKIPGYLGHRHAWEHAIVWLDGQSENATILGVSATGASNRYSTYAPPAPQMLKGTHFKLQYTVKIGSSHFLKAAAKQGRSYALVMWDDMTDEARSALETTDFNDIDVPMIESNFLDNIEDAYPL